MIVEEWPRGLKIKIPRGTRTAPGKRGKVTQFSEASRRALGWVYSQGPWHSMVTLTYHENEIPPPEVSKSHLSMVLQRLRRMGVRYLWVLEWQRRGVPHYHVWLDRRFRDCPEGADVPDGNSWRPIVETWLETTGQAGDARAVAFHRHQKTYTDWEVRVGNNYAAKYADKICQKGLPEGVEAYGRWWGASNGVNKPTKSVHVCEEADMPESNMTESVQTRRVLRRCIEKWSGRKRKKRSSNTGFRYAARENRLGHLFAVLRAYLPQYQQKTESDIYRERAYLRRMFDERNLPHRATPPEEKIEHFGNLGTLSGSYIVRMSTNETTPYTQKSRNGAVADEILARTVETFARNETGLKLTPLGALRNCGYKVRRVNSMVMDFGGVDQSVKNALTLLAYLDELNYIEMSDKLRQCVTDWTELVIAIHKL